MNTHIKKILRVLERDHAKELKPIVDKVAARLMDKNNRYKINPKDTPMGMGYELIPLAELSTMGFNLVAWWFSNTCRDRSLADFILSPYFVIVLSDSKAIQYSTGNVLCLKCEIDFDDTETS